MDPLLAANIVSLVFAFSCRTTDGRATSRLEDHVNRLRKEAAIDGYEIATVHARDTLSGEYKRQTKSDLRAIADNPPGVEDDLPLALHLTSGGVLSLSLRRRSLQPATFTFCDAAAPDECTQVTEADEDGCFFVVTLWNGTGQGHVTLCSGLLMGTLTEEDTTYEIYEIPPELSEPEAEMKRAADATARVLVTWRKERGGSRAARNEHFQESVDVEEVPSEPVEQSEQWGLVKILVPGKLMSGEQKVTLEIKNILDSHFVEDLRLTHSLLTNRQIRDFMMNKWSLVADMLARKELMNGWEVSLKVHMEVWKKHPKWYITSADDTLAKRMDLICTGTKNDSTWDQVTLHTSQIAYSKLQGLSWIGGVCRPRFRCAAVRSLGIGFVTELHELGHSIGLNHDDKMPGCKDDSAPSGFMSDNRDYFRPCYTAVLESAFRSSKNACLYTHSSEQADSTVESFL